MDVNLKGNPFLKVAPTTKNYKLLEKTDTKLHLKVYIRN